MKKAGKSTFNVIESVGRHIEALKPLLPKQALVCIGEYPIKILLSQPQASKVNDVLTVFVGKSSDDIYSWVPKELEPYFILGFEDVKVDTHFWYDVLPYVSKDNTLIESLKKKPLDKLNGALMVSAVWDGINSATLPNFMSKLKNSNINTLGIAILPSKLQPNDSFFNAYASLKMCQSIEGSTVVLTDRDLIEDYEGVDRKGSQIKGNDVTNYLVNLLLSKETFVQEISELSRSFNEKTFTTLLVAGASYKIYGSIENMLNTALLKPLFNFDLSSSRLLYVLLRIPAGLKEKLPLGKVEIAIANWFSKRTSLKSIRIAEPIYVDEANDRVDIALFIGGFNSFTLESEFEQKTEQLKKQAVSKGLMTQDWQAITTPEQPAPTVNTPVTKETETPAEIREESKSNEADQPKPPNTEPPAIQATAEQEKKQPKTSKNPQKTRTKPAKPKTSKPKKGEEQKEQKTPAG